METNQPLFIVGVHRSGTTLLRFMLSSHSRMYIPPESDFIPRFFRKNPHEPLDIRKVTKLLDIIFSEYRFVEDWKGPKPTPSAFYAQMDPQTPAGFLNQLYGKYAQLYSACRWGDKTPIYASYVDLLHTIFPKAQFIHIIRDPFDSAKSLLDKYNHQEYHVDVYFAARNWVRRIRNIQADSKRLPKRHYLEVRYENLVENPETVLQKICTFLGEEFEPIMVEQHKLAKKIINSDDYFFNNVRQPVNTKSLGRGRVELPEVDRRLIQYVVGRLMVELDYQSDELGPMSNQEKIRLTLLQAKYEILQAGRQAATLLGLLPPI